LEKKFFVLLGLGFFFSTFFSIFHFAVFGLSVEGNLISTTQPEAVREVPIVLLRISTKDGKVLGFAQGTNTDKNGHFFFSNIQKEKEIAYRLGINWQGERVSSAIFQPPTAHFHFDFSIEKSLEANQKTKEKNKIRFLLKGSVLFPKKAYFLPQEIQLIQHQLDAENKITTQIIKTARVKKEGEKFQFDFGLIHTDQKTAFKLALAFHNTWLLSSLFSGPRPEKKEAFASKIAQKNISFPLPELKKEEGEIFILRDSVLFHTQKNKMKITEFFAITNPTPYILEFDATPSLYQKNYPKYFENFNFLPNTTHLSLDQNQIKISGFFPPGERVEVLEYEFPFPFFSSSFSFPLFQNTKQFDLLAPFGLTVKAKDASSHKTETQMEEENYQITTLTDLGALSQKEVRFEISNFPTPIWVYWFCAGFLGVLLVLGLLFFSVRLMKKKSLSSPMVG